jgi:hypothetical protein
MFHLASVLVFCLPPPTKVADPAYWQTPQSQAELGVWARRLDSLGIDTNKEEFEAWLWRLTQRYVSLHDTASWPFRPYVHYAHTNQGWSLFSQPQTTPVRVIVEVQQPGVGFRRIYESRSSTHTWRRAEFDHNRIRKFVGRIGRRSTRQLYWQLGDWIARMAARDFPSAGFVRVQLYRYRTAAPGGKVAEGEYTDERLIDLGQYR